MHVAGGGFWHMPGTYILPFSEGTYTVYNNDNKLYVKMITKATGQTYTHRWVDIPRAAKKIHFGWYYMFSHCFDSQDYN